MVYSWTSTIRLIQQVQDPKNPHLGLLTYLPHFAEAKEQVTANLANFAYDPLNFEYLTKHSAIVVFLDLLVSRNEKLIEHGATGISNFCHEPQIHQQLLEDKNLELIQTLLESNNPRILSPALTTLIYLQTGVDKRIISAVTRTRVEELLKGVEAEEKPSKLRNLLQILKDK